MIWVKNCHIIENIIKDHFCKIFIQKREFGLEYFQGDINLIINKIIESNINYIE
jgi:hypothetical protein